MRQHVDLERITHRDTQSYFGILLDNNNRKPICRFHLNNSKSTLVYLMRRKKRSNIQWKVWMIFSNSRRILFQPYRDI
jgi:hypothetical protein